MGKYKNKKIEIKNKTYILQKEIGNGANGCVWLAMCLQDSKEYAIKILIKDCDNKKIERFRKEIEFCENASNLHIIKVFGDGKFDDQICYTMPKYSKTLRNIIDTETDYMILLDYIKQLCEGIKYIHDNSIIHRDIKPENILIDDDSNLVVADFGIAHFFKSDLTQSNEWLGNKSYAAPEQLIKKSFYEVTNACDIYALGKIINEIFTKQNPSGSQFSTISDVEPILFTLDKLVYRCLSQNPNERPSINEVLMEIRLVESQLRESLADIREYLLDYESLDVTDTLVNKILCKASKDILVAQYIFENKTNEEFEKLNMNYHMDIHYKVDSFVKKLYSQKLLLEQCIKKFKYESNSYKSGNPYIQLDLNKIEDNRLYMEFEKILEKYKINYRYDDLIGKILKLFASCCDYHCVELIKNAKELEKAIDFFEDAPIIYIIYKLRKILNKNEIEEIDLIEHISINWKTTKYNEIAENTLYVENNTEEIDILLKFQNQWNIVFSKVDSIHYSVKFWSKDRYNDFKKYALEIAKPYYVFEGDVIDLVKVNREYGGIIEIGPLNSFDIVSTLAKILKIKNIGD